VLLDGFFLIFTADSVRQSNQIRLPFGEGKTSPIAVEDVVEIAYSSSGMDLKIESVIAWCAPTRSNTGTQILTA
jgi:uncharacterized protein YbjT (DUF2867 family)